MAYEQKELLKIRVPCVAYLREMIELKQLKKYPFFQAIIPPDLGKLTPQQAKRYKLQGYSKGIFDATILVANEHVNKVFLIEFKTEEGDYTAVQQAIADSAKNTPVNCLIIRSLDEFVEFVDKELR